MTKPRAVSAKARFWSKFVPVLLLIAAAAGLACWTEGARVFAQPQATASSVEIPRTPAGQTFETWLKAFNRGNPAEMLKFIEERYDKSFLRSTPQGALGRTLTFRRDTGGFDLRSIERSSERTISGLVKERESDTFARIEMEVSADDPPRILKFNLNALPASPGAAARLTEAQLLPAVDAQVKKLAGERKFSGAVAISRNGKTIYSAATGFADREANRPNRVDTQFAMGSMNKMFTAVAIAQLAQRGKLKFTDTVEAVWPEYPNKAVAGKVTIHHLLTHTSGLGDIFGPRFQEKRDALRDTKDYIALYAGDALRFEPGERFSYSNYGFLVLGGIIEKVSGQIYYDYVRENIFKPAGMSRTESFWRTDREKGFAVGYTTPSGPGVDFSKGLPAPVPNWDTLPVRGTSAGGGYTTVEDLLKFVNALLGHKLLDAKHTTTIWEPKTDTGGGPRKYCYGFMSSMEDGKRVVGHGGGAPGMNGDLHIHLERGYVVAVLTNLDPPAAQRLADFVSARVPAGGDTRAAR